jgi:hypothetical protein
LLNDQLGVGCPHVEICILVIKKSALWLPTGYRVEDLGGFLRSLLKFRVHEKRGSLFAMEELKDKENPPRPPTQEKPTPVLVKLRNAS